MDERQAHAREHERERERARESQSARVKVRTTGEKEREGLGCCCRRRGSTTAPEFHQRSPQNRAAGVCRRQAARRSSTPPCATSLPLPSLPSMVEKRTPRCGVGFEPVARRQRFDCALITFSKKALSKLRKESRPRAASLQCSTSQGAGTQHPIHFSCAPVRSHAITASSKASATRQTEQQQTARQALQGKHHNASSQASARQSKQHSTAVGDG